MKRIISLMKMGTESRHLGLSALVVLFFSAFTGLAAFLMIPVWTRIIEPEAYGRFGLFQTIFGIFVAFASLGSVGASVRFLHDDISNDKHCHTVMTTVLKYGICSSSVISVIAGFIYFLFIDTSGFSLFLTLLISFVFLVASFNIELGRSYFVAFEKFFRSSLLQFLVVIFDILLSLAFILFLGFKEDGKIFGLVVATSLPALGVFYYFAKRYGSETVDANKYKEMLRYGFPLIFHQLAFLLLATGDRILIDHFMGLAAVGVYAIVYLFAKPVEYVIAALSQVWSPRYFREMQNGHEGDMKIRKFNSLWVIGLSLFVLSFLWLSPLLFGRLVSEDYQDGVSLLPPIVIGMYFMGLYHLFVGPLHVAKNSKSIVKVTLSSGGLNILLNFLLLPKFGIVGAAYATAFSYLFMCVVICIVTKKIHPQFDQLMRCVPLVLVVVILALLPWGQIGVAFQALSVAILSLLCWFFRAYFAKIEVVK